MGHDVGIENDDASLHWNPEAMCTTMQRKRIVWGVVAALVLLAIIFVASRFLPLAHSNPPATASQPIQQSTGTSVIERTEMHYGDPYTGENTPRDNSRITIYYKAQLTEPAAADRGR